MDISLDYFSQGHWDRVAAARGTASSDIGAALAGSVVDIVAATVPASEPANVLDVGCGTGGLVAALAARLRDARIIGADYSAEAVRIAAAEMAPRRAELSTRVSFVVSPASALPLPDNTFNAVTLLKVAWVLPDLPAALAECRRVLRPDGRLIVQSWAEYATCAAVVVGSEVLVDGVAGFVLPDEAMAPFELTRERLAKEMVGAGFQVEAQSAFTTEVVVDSASGYWRALRTLAGTAYWAYSTQPPADRERLDTAWEALVAPWCCADGTVRLPLGWHLTVGRV